jgi:phosphatidylserine/phosphatidylglycerophosphate/cardiolipin synthase-like enzyme
LNRKVWPWNPKPLAYVDRRLVERSQDGYYQHAKAVIVDAGTQKGKALITSANFSETAQRHNYEAGCMLRSTWQVDRISQHFQSLVGQRHFVQLPL